jgi:transposase-like protein
MCYNLQICRPCQCTGEGNGRYGDRRTWDDIHNPQKVKELKKIMSDKWKGDMNPSKMDEVKIKKKQSIINEEFLKDIVEKRKFRLISVIELCGKKSKIKVECPNGHISDKVYVNFVKKDNKYKCERCYYDSISLNLTDEELTKIRNYVRQVRSLTAKNYKLYKDFINPENLKIGKTDYHLDHKYSIFEGYRNSVDVKVIASKENLEVIPSKENLSKQQRCSIPLDELINITKYL